MKHAKYLLLAIVLCSIVGCGEKKSDYVRPLGGQKIDVLDIYAECQRCIFEKRGDLSVDSSGDFMLYFSNMFGEDKESAPHNTLVEERLREEIEKYSDDVLFSISNVLGCDAVEEFVVTADKTLFGRAPGEHLNNFFLANTRNDLLITYPDLKIEVDVDPNKFQSIENIVGPNFMLFDQIILAPKEIPAEFMESGYEEITFTIRQRLVSGKEFTDSCTITLSAYSE